MPAPARVRLGPSLIVIDVSAAGTPGLITQRDTALPSNRRTSGRRSRSATVTRMRADPLEC